MKVQVTWNQAREDAYYFVIADLTADGWEFWERDSWEIRWFRMKATGELISKAESFLRYQRSPTAVPTVRTGREGFAQRGKAEDWDDSVAFLGPAPTPQPVSVPLSLVTCK
jgi:hypothetical protein